MAFDRRPEGFRDDVERVVPGDPLPGAGIAPVGIALRSLPPERMEEPVGVVDALGVAGDLGADDAGRVVVLLRAVDAPDGALVQYLDVERAGRRTIMRTGRMADFQQKRAIHGLAP
jgi:xanthine/CO dehydrogenase XdhC/CoxF family maturation factor